MNNVTNLELRDDPLARTYMKNEVVQVEFAQLSGVLQSREGPNSYEAGDALIVGSTGDRWSVTRDRFDTKYEPLPPMKHGEDGTYRNKPVPLLAKQMPAAFSIKRSAASDLIHGKAGDWLMQYAPGDYGIVENAKFQKVYRLTDK